MIPEFFSLFYSPITRSEIWKNWTFKRIFNQKFEWDCLTTLLQEVNKHWCYQRHQNSIHPSIFLTVYPIHCGGGLLKHKSWKRTQTLISGFPVYLEKRQQVEFARSGWVVGDRQQEVTPRFIWLLFVFRLITTLRFPWAGTASPGSTPLPRSRLISAV